MAVLVVIYYCYWILIYRSEDVHVGMKLADFYKKNMPNYPIYFNYQPLPLNIADLKYTIKS